MCSTLPALSCRQVAKPYLDLLCQAVLFTSRRFKFVLKVMQSFPGLFGLGLPSLDLEASQTSDYRIEALEAAFAG